MHKTHEIDLRVRYHETDNMGVVYYGNYFVWFEIARTEYFRSMGLSYKELEKNGIYMMVASANCHYKSPATYDDLVRVMAWVSELKNSSLKFVYKLFIGERLIATGDTIHVFTNESGKPIRIPEEVRRLF